MRRSCQRWNGCEPPPATARFSFSAVATIASRMASCSVSSWSYVVFTFEFTSIMLSVISGFTSPGRLIRASRGRMSAAPRDRSKLCVFTTISSSSMPKVSAVERVNSSGIASEQPAARAEGALGVLERLAGDAQAGLGERGPQDLHDQDRREEHRQQVEAEL